MNNILGGIKLNSRSLFTVDREHHCNIVSEKLEDKRYDVRRVGGYHLRFLFSNPDIWTVGTSFDIFYSTSFHSGEGPEMKPESLCGCVIKTENVTV